MKEAAGELNLTVITIIAIAAIVGFFMTVLWPMMQESITTGWEEIDSYESGYN